MKQICGSIYVFGWQPAEIELINGKTKSYRLRKEQSYIGDSIRIRKKKRQHNLGVPRSRNEWLP